MINYMTFIDALRAGLSVAASIVGLLGATAKVSSILATLVKSTKAAP